MRLRGVRVPALLLALAMGAGRAAAHPHMSLEAKVEIELAGRELRGAWMEWTMDPFFSAAIIGEHDADRNGRFDAKENERVFEYAFSNLRKYGYFVWVRQGARRINPDRVESFQASQRGGRLVYRFRVPLEGKGIAGDFSLSVFDSSFFCAATYAKEGARLAAGLPGAAGALPGLRVAVNRDYPIYYDPNQPASDLRVHTAPGPGLLTAYPEEIHVRFP